MLKRRVVLLLCFNDGVLFRTKRFVPDYRYTARLVGNRNADEVVVIDVTPPGQGDRKNFYKALEAYAQECFSPITVGGGIRTLDEVGLFIKSLCGDKVLIGLEHLVGTSLGERIAEKFGKQALVAAINHHEGDCLRSLANLAVFHDAGEILLNSIDRDGSLMGYDLVTLGRVAGAVDVPLVVAGGCGTWQHMADAFAAGADAACTSVIHHFPETSLAACKRWLVEHNQPVRPAAA